MAETTLYFYREASGEVPVLEWLTELVRRDRRAALACISKLDALRKLGRTIRRPYADLLRDGVFELRAKVGHVNYRVLFFFHGQDIAIVAHGLSKEREVPVADIDRAVERKRRYEKDPTKHRAEEPVPEDADDL